jgi:hypothetical protein
MLDWRHEINGALSDFEIVSKLTGDHLSLDETSLEFWVPLTVLRGLFPGARWPSTGFGAKASGSK